MVMSDVVENGDVRCSRKLTWFSCPLLRWAFCGQQVETAEQHAGLNTKDDPQEYQQPEAKHAAT